MQQSVWVFANPLPVIAQFWEHLPASTPILMVESQTRARRYCYHKKKLVLVFSAMRHYAEQLRAEGRIVDYYPLSEAQTFLEALENHLDNFQPQTFLCASPTEYSHLQGLHTIERNYPVRFEVVPNDLFLADLKDFQKRAAGKKSLRLEYFYRRMRKQLNLLIDPKGQPYGGKWNYDAENRLGYTPDINPGIIPMFEPDALTQEVMKDINEYFPDHPGVTTGFTYPVTREQAVEHLQRFVTNQLDLFGPYEDMMIRGEAYLYHSVLSPLLNLGLLHPREVVREVLTTYNAGHARLQSTEAMIRQIIGWREFIYAVYWTKMPAYATSNYLNAQRKMPAFFWTGEIDLACLREVLQQSLNLGYAHHIQRLMIISNFCTLAGFHPREVLTWFMEMFVDAYEWVMLPNVYGMGLFADGGFISSKPYISSGAYINRMSNYCHTCAYQVKKKLGDNACPFNYLYWDFLIRNRQMLQQNSRLALVYKMLNKKSPEEQQQIQQQSQRFIERIASDTRLG